MTKETEDALGELYAWDSTIDDVWALPENDAARDEDQALDAYEEIIQMADIKTSPWKESDSVLSLAAQLLTKHFFKFPHVQLNVVDVLLALCGADRSQAVRIHTIRSLLQILKTSYEDNDMTRDWSKKIQDAMASLMSSETSGVIMRHMTQLNKALKEKQKEVSDNYEAAPQKSGKETPRGSSKTPTARSLETPREVVVVKPTTGQDYEHQHGTPTNQFLKKPKQFGEDERTVASKRFDGDNGYQHKGDTNGNENEPHWRNEHHAKSRLEERQQPHETPGRPAPPTCPPGPYLFIGNVPRDTSSSDIAEFLRKVDPNMMSTCVQVKQPPHHSTGYAFVSMPSTEIAREAIRYVSTVKFNGRLMHGNFARGPPSETILFVERVEGKNMAEDDDAVRSVDFERYDPSVWEQMCDRLRDFGSLEVIHTGKIRFRNVEDAKAVIRKNHFIVKGHEIIPIYDPEEQLLNDAARVNQRGSSGSKQGFALKSGRLVGDRDSRGNYDKYGGDRDRSDVRDFKQPNDRGGYRRRSQSPPHTDRSGNRGRSKSRSTSPSGKRSASHYSSQRRSRSPILNKRKGNDSRAPPRDDRSKPYDNKGLNTYERGHQHPRSRSRSAERYQGKYESRDERPSIRRLENDERDRGRAFGDHDQPFDRPRRSNDRRDNGNRINGGGSRYGPSGGVEIPNDRFEESRFGKRLDRRDAPLAKYDSPDVSMGKHRSRSPPPRHGGHGSYTHSPQQRRMSEPQPYGSGNRGREDRRGDRPGDNDRRNDDRSIAEIAREQEMQRQQYQQRNRRDREGGQSRYGGNNGVEGRPENFAKPARREERSFENRNPSQFRSRSRSRSRSPGRPFQQQFRQPPQQNRHHDDIRERRHSSPPPLPQQKFQREDSRDWRRPTPQPPQRDEYSRGRSARSPPRQSRQPERNDLDMGFSENRNHSPPPSPLLASSIHRPHEFVDPKHKQSPHTDFKDRSRRDSGRHDRGRGDRHDREKGDRADRQERGRGIGGNKRGHEHHNKHHHNVGRRMEPETLAPSSPVDMKRLRSMTPSPVRRDTHSKKRVQSSERHPSSSPQRKYGGVDSDHVVDKKRRVEDDSDDDVRVTKANDMFADIDECMVDYEED